MMIDPPCPCAMSVGMAALAVCQTPVKLTSITSCHCSSLNSHDHPTLRMPALATTMSTRPSSATPSSKAAWSAAMSRTSARRATTRRPSLPTNLAVSSRSSGVAGAYLIVSNPAQRSTAMMSAPSAARRSA